MQREQDVKGPSPQVILIVGIIAILVIGIGVIVLKGTNSNSELSKQQPSNTASSTVNPSPISPEAQKSFDRLNELKKNVENRNKAGNDLINEFFLAKSKGQSVDQYYCDNRTESISSKFYAVRQWAIIGSVGDMGMFYTVRVDSSNKDGQPITKLYKVNVSENNGKSCINCNSQDLI